MPRTKKVQTEPTETKKPGRKVGQEIERQPDIIVTLNKDYRVKIDKYNKTLQQKCKEKDKEKVENEEEDKGYRNLGHFVRWEHIFSKLVDVLTKDKARKVEIMPFEEYQSYFEKSTLEARKMFGKIDMVEM